MCGIAGIIGTSKKPKVSYKILTHLFSALEERGTDAAGCWGVEAKAKPSIIYHKEPIKSSEFITTPFWKDLQNLNPNLFLLHARKASYGVGTPYINKNNHPFVSVDKRIGLVHNGKINESNFLSKSYETVTTVDSEILLRMYENPYSDELKIDNTPNYINERLLGIHDIFSVVNEGSMAVSIGELHADGSRTLFLFRNEKRPIWLVDLRKALGQIVFFSDPVLWEQAVINSKQARELGYCHRLSELPNDEVWVFKIDNKKQMVIDENFYRFQVVKHEKEIEDWIEPSNKKKIGDKKLNLSVITNLIGEEEKAPTRSVKSTPIVYNNNYKNNYDDYEGYYDGDGWSAQHWYGNNTKSKFSDNLPSDVPVSDFTKKAIEEEIQQELGEGLEIDDDLPEDSTIVFNDKDEAIELDTSQIDNDVWQDDDRFDDWDHKVIEGKCEIISEQIEKIKNYATQIETIFINNSLEGSTTNDSFEDLTRSLEETERDLLATYTILKSN